MKLKVTRRAFYPFLCEGCGQKRYSRIYDRAVNKKCRNCRRNIVPENQPSLFDIDKYKNNPILMTNHDPKTAKTLNYIKKTETQDKTKLELVGAEIGFIATEVKDKKIKKADLLEISLV